MILNNSLSLGIFHSIQTFQIRKQIFITAYFLIYIYIYTHKEGIKPQEFCGGGKGNGFAIIIIV